MGRGEKKWDATAERDLCIAVIMASQEGRVTYNWPKTHAIMDSIGHAFTKDAMSQHFTKRILKDFKTRHGDIIGSAPSTPKKASATPAKRKAPAAKAAKKLAEAKPDDDDDADGDSDDVKLAATPSKRVKIEKQQTPTIKKEKQAKRGRSQVVDFDEDDFQTWLDNDD
ncbi:hypothetical protein HRG_002466 [Hirsutella rhossiliensis]|uniref:Uncharacterized protein n=1 Tax=Hirsutella rhossiliensis TaxID=111463 RepID=A0A9P8N5N6_9HYPO|nr:uncharacterized protein HRG_02466 [Hirsutella rhossiliensis]KAH0967057.1 hypothetical protein HRG_02466 [Hirsutella rhossiliensis]